MTLIKFAKSAMVIAILLGSSYGMAVAPPDCVALLAMQNATAKALQAAQQAGQNPGETKCEYRKRIRDLMKDAEEARRVYNQKCT